MTEVRHITTYLHKVQEYLAAVNSSWGGTACLQCALQSARPDSLHKSAALPHCQMLAQLSPDRQCTTVNKLWFG